MRNFTKAIRIYLKDFLSFNYAERRGIIVLVFLILITEGVNAFLPHFIKRQEYDMTAFEKEVSIFEAALKQADTLKKWQQKKDVYKRTSPDQTTYKRKAGLKQSPLMIEINTADTVQLVRLSGIGPVFAGRILKYRGLLGGFFSAEQLLEVYGMDSIRYDGIKRHLKVDTSQIVLVPINEAEFKTLLRHPYLDYESVKQICNYREKQNPISCSDTLRVVIGYDPMFEKVRHYISY